MCQFWPQTPGPKIVVGARLHAEDDDGHGDQRDGDKENRLVSEHHGVHNEDEQGHEEADGMQESSTSEKTLLQAGLESPHPE